MGALRRPALVRCLEVSSSLHDEKTFVSVGDTSVVVCDVGDDSTVTTLLSDKRGDGPSWLAEEARSHVRGELGIMEVLGLPASSSHEEMESPLPTFGTSH